MLTSLVKTTANPCHFFQFDSVGELIAETRKSFDFVRGTAFHREVTDCSHTFVGRKFSPFSSCFPTANEFWAEGVETISKMVEDCRGSELPRPTNIRRTSRWSEDGGDEVCLDRLKAGNAYWRTTGRDHRPGPQTVTMICGLGGNGCHDWKDLLWRGAAAITLTQILEDAGYRVELHGIRHVGRAYNDRHEQAYSVCYKRPNDQLDVSTLVNAVSGWFHRTIGFASGALRGTHSHLRDGIGYWLPVEALVPFVSQDPTQIVCDCLWSKEEALTLIRDTLANFTN